MTKSKSDGEAAAPRATKASIVLDLLRRENGATLAELVDATGWLPHTTRAALTGLRKKGHVLDKSTRDNATCYRIEAA
jgi:DNA-binding IclR family transcriptional regulator